MLVPKPDPVNVIVSPPAVFIYYLSIFDITGVCKSLYYVLFKKT